MLRSFGGLHRGLPLLSATLTVSLSPSPLFSQDDQVVHRRAEFMLRHAGDWPLPRGDTLIEFNKSGPILYTVVSSSHDTISSAMIRNDGMVGWETSTWSDGRLTGCSARWLGVHGVQVNFAGTVSG